MASFERIVTHSATAMVAKEVIEQPNVNLESLKQVILNLLNALTALSTTPCTKPWTHKQDNFLELVTRHILNFVCALLISSSCPEQFWGEAALIAVYLINRIPSSILNNKSPYERLHGTSDELYNASPRAPTSSVEDDLLAGNALDNFEPSFTSSSISPVDSTNELVVPSLSHSTRIKTQSDGSVERYKARLVAKGFTQEYGIDYEETFAPVARLTSVHSLLAIVALWRWKLFQMDVKNAFLNGDLEEEVYMKPPPWLNHPPNKTARGVVLLLLYVDDMIITGDDVASVEELKQSLSQKFKMKDLGVLRYFLGLEVTSSDDGYLLFQVKYASDLISKAELNDGKSVSTPLEPNLKLTPMDGFHFLISLAISNCQFMTDPHSTHYAVVLCIIRYVKGTLCHGLHFSANSSPVLRTYSDADWVGDLLDRRSTTSYCLFLELLSLRWLLEDMGIPQPSSTDLYCDNQSAMQIAHNDVFHECTKHIEESYIRTQGDPYFDGLLRLDGVDVGSVASAIIYAFYLNRTLENDEFFTVPIINMHRAELSSHAELIWLLDSCQIDQSSLIYFDEVFITILMGSKNTQTKLIGPILHLFLYIMAPTNLMDMLQWVMEEVEDIMELEDEKIIGIPPRAGTTLFQACPQAATPSAASSKINQVCSLNSSSISPLAHDLTSSPILLPAHNSTLSQIQHYPPFRSIAQPSPNSKPNTNFVSPQPPSTLPSSPSASSSLMPTHATFISPPFDSTVDSPPTPHQPLGIWDLVPSSDHQNVIGRDMAEAKPVSSPIATTALQLHQGLKLSNPSSCRRLVGSLQYLNLTRPNITFAVNRLSQFLHAPFDVHMQAAKRILRYLKGSVFHGLLLHRQPLSPLHAFSDSDWAGDKDTLHSTEAENRALAAAFSEVIWVCNLIRELGHPVSYPPALCCDNIGATHLSSYPIMHTRIKHIAIDLHFVCELVD
ncbi:hypothetical protein SLEP1_g37236 [Rubroshorea leprosula]|uniref:Reverse transcriptase Ty1/copia-type domain-containing protein n=1 Tax=Rubroshorea leprosula TaxID=152421 RepID=A0AAV5KU08_9ROSI|nr:hypothetical protein SLEP1_g37236 [Rubroshorea leprosula]